MSNTGGNRSVSIKFDAAGAMAGLDKLEMAAGEHVRAAAQAGADVLYREVLFRVPVGRDSHFFYGTHQKYLFPAGTLRDSIYQVYSTDNSVEHKRATYHVAWNHRKAPYGFMVEYGTSRASAHPFLRPAYDAAKTTALNVSYDVFHERMATSIKALSA